MDHVKFTEYGAYLSSLILLVFAAYIYQVRPTDMAIPAILVVVALIDLLVIKFYLVPMMRKK
ncbi:MAG TPA: hypothetical protein VJI13_05705 [Candidatus Norongarragalinales archaeon]|nr:hypothetical protein [Candidatus Norongarragalinales archaeon]